MKLIKQLFKFGIVGVVAAIIDYSLLYILTECFNMYYLISSTISFVVSVIFNYILSIYWVFDVKKKQKLKDFILFIVLSAIGLLLNQIILFIGSSIINIYYMFSKLIATIIVMIYNFITRKIFIEK